MAGKKNPAVKKTVNTSKNKPVYKKTDRRIYIYAILIAVLTVIVFSNSLKNNFVRNFDDIIYTTSADNVKALSAKDIGTIFTSYVAGIYHPLTVLSLAIETNLFGPGAYHFHLINLMLHVFNVLLVFWFIQRLTKRIEISVIVALFFGIHPMHVESVSWISERKDVLYTFFYLGSLISYLKFIKNDTKYKYLWYSIILFLFSLLSKSAAVSLAPLIVLLDFYLGRKFITKTVLEKIPYFLLALLFGIVSLISQGSAGSLSALSDFNFNFSFFDNVFLICHSVMFYIIKAITPFYLSAVHYYPQKINGALPLEYYLSPLGIALIIFIIMKFKKIRRDMIFGFLFFFLTIALVLQFVPVGYTIVSERYSYVPYIGLFFITGKLFCDFSDNKFGNYSKPLKNLFIFFIVIISLFFSYLTYERNNAWKNGITLFDDVIKKNPDIGHAYWARGTAKIDMGDNQGALDDFNNAIKHNYKYADAYDSKGNCYFEMGDYKTAITIYDEAIKVDTEFALSYYNRAHSKQKLQDYAGSIDDYKKAIAYNIENPGLAYNEMSLSQLNLNDLQGALTSLNKAIEANPGSANDYIINRGKIEYLQKDYDASLMDFNQAIIANPKSDLAFYNRGMLKLAINDTNEACDDFSKASALGNTKAGDAMNLYCKSETSSFAKK